jgi:predicted PhzF superfamily epimerase YddE/YHI9
MTLELVVVDAFTDRPFTGNPAAVAVVEAFPDEARMQAVAAEMALSETAFCVGRPDGDHDLRWFTPTVEVDLCGHATLATAHVLGRAARFHTRSGLLTCRSEGETMWMDFPADPPSEGPPPAGLALERVQAFATCRADALVELADAASVRALEPDLGALGALGTRGVVVTAAGDRPGVDCVSRFFAPNAGIPEDPVTGSAHCALAVWWAARTGRRELVGEQASARGGTVRMLLEGDRVQVGGSAVTVSRVEMVA